jgi:hypothetical protein
MIPAGSHDKMCNPEHYQHLTGSINHLAVFTRPDISFAAAKHNSMQTQLQRTFLQYFIFYVISKAHGMVVYKPQEHLNILGYSDSDWAFDTIDTKSFTGNIFMMHGGPATWTAHKQTTVAHSLSI